MRKWESVGFVTGGQLVPVREGEYCSLLYKVKYSYSVPDRTEKTCSVRTEKQVSLAVNSP